MKKVVLNIGAVKTVNQAVTFSCFGLGSCIGLFVQDRATGISGGAHILLPDNESANFNDGLHYSAASAIDMMLEQFLSQGSTLKTLRAKLVGGANVIEDHCGVGDQNIRSVTNELVKRKIFIAAKDVGGKKSRTAHFNTSNGDMLVKTHDNTHFKIY